MEETKEIGFSCKSDRVISFKLKKTGGVIRHVFRSPTREDAIEFFKGQEVKQDDGTSTVDVITPSLQLYAKLAIRAEGFAVNGGGHICDLPDWQQRIPRNDRFMAIYWLTRVIRDPNRQPEADPDDDIVFLSAISGESAPGELLWTTGLVHRFAPMTQQDDLELNRKVSRGLVIGGSRNGAIVRPLKQKIFLELYDKKIRSVEGYDCEPREVDPFHKIEAISQLVSASSDIEMPIEIGEAEKS
jgi:hypothetical protein